MERKELFSKRSKEKEDRVASLMLSLKTYEGLTLNYENNLEIALTGEGVTFIMSNIIHSWIL
jgi:hypothetical protein